MNDLIYRNYLIEKFSDTGVPSVSETGKGYDLGIAAALRVVKNAPSANLCISVKDALPDIDGEYLVYTDHYEIAEYDTELQQFGHTDEYKDELGYNIVEWYEVNNVTHWMPLPKQPESEVQNG